MSMKEKVGGFALMGNLSSCQMELPVFLFAIQKRLRLRERFQSQIVLETP